MINADDALKAVFGGKKSVSMFEMTKLVSKHLKKPTRRVSGFSRDAHPEMKTPGKPGVLFCGRNGLTAGNRPCLSRPFIPRPPSSGPCIPRREGSTACRAAQGAPPPSEDCSPSDRPRRCTRALPCDGG